MEETLTSIGVLKGNIRRNIKVYGERCGEVKIKRKVYLCWPKISTETETEATTTTATAVVDEHQK